MSGFHVDTLIGQAMLHGYGLDQIHIFHVSIFSVIESETNVIILMPVEIHLSMTGFKAVCTALALVH